MGTGSGWSERQRLGFLVERDGTEAAEKWARRTMQIYRRAVLTPRHFASMAQYRRRFIESYCEFKRWIVRRHEPRTGSAREGR